MTNSKPKIQAEITLGEDYCTYVHGDTIEEIIEKIKKYHLMSQFEKDRLIEKGKLDEAIATGWYLK